jgi:predicted RNA methylase
VGRVAIPKAMSSRQRHKKIDRGHDLYETPPEATRALLACERLPHTLWEASCGRGAIVRVLRGAGHDVLATDLIDYDSPDQDFSGFNFLSATRLPMGVEAIVQNPPFGHANAFVRKSLELCSRVYMLLRLAYLESIGRDDVLNQLQRVHVFSNRLPMMHRDGWTGKKTSSTTAFAWFVFDRYHQGATQLYRIRWESEGLDPRNRNVDGAG